MKIKEYNLKITERQANLIMNALDLFTRLSAGQFHGLKDISFEKDKKGLHRQPSNGTLQMLHREMFPKLNSYNASYGIHSKDLPDKVREVYDIFKVMMYEFNKDKGAINVYADKVRQASKQSLPVFDKIVLADKGEDKRTLNSITNSIVDKMVKIKEDQVADKSEPNSQIEDGNSNSPEEAYHLHDSGSDIHSEIKSEIGKDYEK